jgi:hypothetical protein
VSVLGIDPTELLSELEVELLEEGISISGADDPESLGPDGDGPGSLGANGKDPATPAPAIPAPVETKHNPRPVTMTALIIL